MDQKKQPQGQHSKLILNLAKKKPRVFIQILLSLPIRRQNL